MSEDTKLAKAVLKACIAIKANRGPINGAKRIQGLCAAVDACVYGRDAADDLLSDLFRDWPEFSGSTMYPVTVPGHDPEQLYNHTYDMWDVDQGGVEGEYAKARFRLLDYVIERLTEMTSMSEGDE